MSLQMSNMRLTVLLALILVTLCLANERTGVYFLYRNTIYMKHSNWVISIVNELDPYEKHTLDIKAQLDQFSEAFATYSTNISRNSSLNIWPESIKFLTKAEENFRGEYFEIQSLYQSVRYLVDMRLVNGRNKRAVIPFIGSVMSYLFGTISEDDIVDIREKMSKLEANQEKTTHILDESLTVINLTYEGVKANRKVINKLSKVVDGLKTKINDIYEALRKGIQNARIILMVHDVYNIVSDAMLDTRLSLQKLTNIIEHSNRGQLTTELISPPTLKSMLRTIRRKLTDGMDLPYPLTPRGLKMYYANLQPILLPGKGQFYITLVIPIIHDQTEFEIFDIINEPVYDSESKLSAKMVIDTSSIAISRNRAEYVVLDSNERIFCLVNPFCDIRSPVYNIPHAETCITALFEKDVDKVKRICKTQIVGNEYLPHAYQLFDDQWLFTTNEPLTADKRCNGVHESITLAPGHTLLTIENNCELSTKVFHIPKRKIGGTEIKTQVRFAYDIETSWSLPHVWNLTRANLFDHLEEIPLLTPMENIPLKSLKEKLRNVMSEQQPFHTTIHSHVNTGLVITIVCVLIMLIVLLVRYRKLIAKVLTNQSITHSSKPTAPKQATEDGGKPSETERLSSADQPGGDVTTWMPASSTTRTPLTGDVILLTTGQDAALDTKS